MALQTTETVAAETGSHGKAAAVAQTTKSSDAAPFTKLVTRILMANAVAAPVGGAVALLTGASNLTGFLTGYLVGLANMLLLARSAERGLAAGIGKAERIVAGGYYARFGLTIFVLGAAVLVLKVEPIPLIVGFTVSVATTIISVILSLRKES